MKPARAAKQALREEISRLRRVGAQLSNVAFKYCQQSDVGAENREMYRQLVSEWDAIPRAERAATKRRGVA